MKRYLIITLLSTLVIAGFGCKKKSQSRTAQIKSGTYVGMGSTSSSDLPSCVDAFTELIITVVNDTSISLGSTVLPYLSTEAGTNKLVFGSYGYGNQWETLSFDPASGAFQHSYAYYSSSGQGASSNLSTADYRRHGDLKPLINNIKGVRTMSGTRSDWMWRPGGEIDSTGDVTAEITFTPSSDSTIAFSGLLDSGVLYYKKVDETNQVVIFQTHHTRTSYSTLTYNYVSNKFTFEQLGWILMEKHYVRLQ